jgi:hypothetical protein
MTWNNAGYLSSEGWYLNKVVAGGGGSAAFLAANNAVGSNSLGSVSFSTGTVVLGIVADRGSGGNSPNTAPTINGVTATQVGTTISDGTTNGVSLWRANVTAGTGTITINGNGASDANAFVAWMLTGLSSSTPTQVQQTNGFAVQVPDPQTVTLTSLAAGSVIVGFLGRNFPATQNPTTWLGITRDVSAEQTQAGSNGAISAGGHQNSASGTVVVAATAQATQSWMYSGLITAAWS